MKDEFELLYNDYFKILKILKDTTQTIDNISFSPISYEEIGNKLHLTKQTIIKHMSVLKEEGYVVQIKKGRLQVTEKGLRALKKMS